MVVAMPPGPVAVGSFKPFHMTGEEVVVVKMRVTVVQQCVPAARELHVVLDEPILPVSGMVKEETQGKEMATAWHKRVGMGV